MLAGSDMFDEEAVELAELKKYFLAHTRSKECTAHSSKVHSVKWNNDGRRIASGSFDKTVSLFHFAGERLSKDYTFRGHQDSVDQLCWHPKNPDLFATASHDKTVKVWDARSQRSVTTVSTRGENINICWSPNGEQIAVGDRDDHIMFIDANNYRVLQEKSFEFEVNEISWNRDGDMFYLTSGTGEVHVLSYPDLKNVIVLNAHPGTCICIDFDPTGKLFAVGAADAIVSIWNVEHLVCLRTVTRLDWPPRTLSFSHDGKILASASEDLIIDLTHVDTGERIFSIPTQSPTFTVAFHPSKYLLAYSCDEKDSYNRDGVCVKVYGLPNDTA